MGANLPARRSLYEPSTRGASCNGNGRLMRNSSSLIRKSALLVGLLPVCFASVRPAIADPGSGADPALVQKIEALLNAPEFAAGFQGVLVQSARDNRILYARNADRVFLPASNNKLLTAAAALALLGADFVYRTEVCRAGELTRDGTLRGDLILRGSGDPLLMVEDLEDLVRQIVGAGIRHVRGSVRFDETLFDEQRLGEGWEWDDEPYAYSAQVSALNVNANVVQIVAAPGAREGDPVRISLTPNSAFVTVQNSARTAARGTRGALEVTRERGRNIVYVRGSLASGAAAEENAPIRVTVEDPSRFAAAVFVDALRRAGVRISGRQIDRCAGLPPGAEPVATHVSPPLAQVVQRMNKPSNNLVAECLMKTVGAIKTGRGTSGASGSGVQQARNWLGSIGLDLTQLLQADGSGLSRHNYVSPRNLVRLLLSIRRAPQYSAFYDSLPIAGVDGTLRSRMRGTAAAGNCRAKTGTSSHVSSLSGYVTAADGEPLVFSLLMNNHLGPASACTAAQDRIVALLAEWKPTAPAGAGDPDVPQNRKESSRKTP